MNTIYTILKKRNHEALAYASFIFLSLLALTTNGYSQMVGTCAYVQGTSVEYAIDGAGGYEGVQTGTYPTPGGYHFRSNNPIFGFVSNPQVNGWTTYDGDFFTPGTPENGWGIEIIDGATDLTASNNCNYQIDIPGAITGYVIDGLCRIVTWEANYISGGYNLHIKIDYVLRTPDLYYTTVVTITNNGVAIPDFYYYRNFDPDNNVSINGFDYSTQNTIQSQPGSGCNKAHVKATSTNPGSQPLSYVGLAGVGTDFRAIYGGFSNRDASDIWNNIGFTQAAGSTNFADEAIAIAYRIQNLTAGSTQSFRYVVILDDNAANNAVNNLFTFSWPGAPPSAATLCNPVIDTITICNGAITPISVNGSALTDFNWTWSPAAGLNTTSGATVNANPTVNTMYTVTGTPINPCFNTVTQQIYVRVVAGTTSAEAGPGTTLTCATTSTVLGGSSGSGGTYSWAGPGIVSGGSTLTPTVNAAGTYTLTVDQSGCAATDTVIILANQTAPNANAGPDFALSCSLASVNLGGSSTTPGVTFSWAGPGIVSGGNTASPNVNALGDYTVTVTNPANSCTSTDIANVNGLVTPPNVNAGPDMFLNCVVFSQTFTGSSTTPGVTYTWTGPGITAGANTANPTVNALGTYTLTVFDAVTGCSASDNVDLLSNISYPIADFSYSPTEINEFDPLVKFTNGSSAAVSYFWDLGDGTTSTASDPSHLYGDTGTYCVQLIATNMYGCTDSINHCLVVKPEFNVFIPNSFTCNEDGLNEMWRIVGRGVKTIEVRIFDRWGEELYSFYSIDKGWPGTRQNGNLCQQGVYVYKVTVQDGKGDWHEYSGNVNLIR